MAAPGAEEEVSVKIISWVWENSPYEGKELLLHLAMADHANDSGWFFAAQSSLASKSRCSVEHVRLTARRMVADGFLVIEKVGSSVGRATEYRLIRPVDNHAMSVDNSDISVDNFESNVVQLPNSLGPQATWSPNPEANSPTPPATNRLIQPIDINTSTKKSYPQEVIHRQPMKYCETHFKMPLPCISCSADAKARKDPE